MTFKLNSMARGEPRPKTPVPAPTRNASLAMLLPTRDFGVLLMELLLSSHPFMEPGGRLKLAKLNRL